MNASTSFQLAIVGGGLVGKCMALLCAQQGLRVALLAPRPAADSVNDGTALPAWDSRIYALSSSSQTLLEKLRVWPQLDRARIEPVADMRVFGDAGGALHFSAYAAAVPQLAWIVESSHIERVLDTALGFAHRVQQFDQSAVGLQVDDQQAMLILADGQRLSAECVIGADGANSWVRQQCSIDIALDPYGQTAVVANFAAELPHRGAALQWFLGTARQPLPAVPEQSSNDAGEILALLPLPGHHLSLVWSATEEHARQLLALSPEALAETVQAAVGGAVGRHTGRLQCVTPARGFTLAMRRAKRLIAPRVALIGDAAHVIHPLAGQGMNLGLRDVTELGRILAERETFRGLGDAKLLRRYERARRGDMELMAMTMHGLHQLFALPGTLPETARNLGMRLVSSVPPLKRFLIDRALG